MNEDAETHHSSGIDVGGGQMVNKGFLTWGSIKIFILGAISFGIATASGVIFA